MSAEPPLLENSALFAAFPGLNTVKFSLHFPHFTEVGKTVLRRIDDVHLPPLAREPDPRVAEPCESSPLHRHFAAKQTVFLQQLNQHTIQAHLVAAHPNARFNEGVQGQFYVVLCAVKFNERGHCVVIEHERPLHKTHDELELLALNLPPINTPSTRPEMLRREDEQLQAQLVM